MAEFSAGLQTQQEKRYVILLFLLLLGFFMTIALAIPPLTVKNRGDALIWDRAFNRANTVLIGAWEDTDDSGGHELISACRTSLT